MRLKMRRTSDGAGAPPQKVSNMQTWKLALGMVVVVVAAAGCAFSDDEAARANEASYNPVGSGGKADVAGNDVIAQRRAGGTIAHLNRWRWHDIMVHMEEIKNAGYSAILVSPHTATCGGGFSDGYDPSDFTSFHSRFGTEDELYWLVNTAHHHGLEIYADMIVNHMCARESYDYARFGWDDFHHNGPIRNWDDPWELENHDLLGLHDLAQGSPYVRGELYNYLVKTNNLGFDGYRWDAVKHVPRWYWRDHVLGNTNSWGKFNFGEVYSANIDELRSYADLGMSVTDFNLYDAMFHNFRKGGNLAALDGAGYAAQDGFRAMTFVENHDVGAPQNRHLAYAFLAAYPGYPTFYDVSLRDHAMNNLVWIREHKAHGRYINRHKEQNVLIFEREHNLLAAINQSGEWQTRWVDTSWRNTGLRDYTGNTDFDRWAGGDGRVEVSIPPMSYVMLAP